MAPRCEAVHPLAGVWWDTAHLLGWEHGHVNMLAHFADAVVNGTAVEPYGATCLDGLRAAQVSEAALISARGGNRVTVEGIPSGQTATTVHGA